MSYLIYYLFFVLHNVMFLSCIDERFSKLKIVNSTALIKNIIYPSNPHANFIHPWGGKLPSPSTENKNGTPSSHTQYPIQSTTGESLHPLYFHENTIMVTEMSVQSPVLLINSTKIDKNSTSENATDTQSGIVPNKGIIDWILGAVGVQPEQSTDAPTVTHRPTPPKNCPKCECGLTYKNTRIVGGLETQINEYPWMTALMYNNRFYCGASLINNKYLLTAAHCVNGFSKDRLSATFLDHDRTNSFETRTFTRKIRDIYRHKYYGSGGNYNNDIAILKLDAEVPLNGMMKPVCLPPIGKSFTGHKGVVTGWGATQEHGQVSNRLREVEVPIMSNIDCKRTGYNSRITDNMLCAGYAEGKKDSCQGDSGGPLHVKNGSSHIIAGIVSWGEGCAVPNYPGVYTRVNRYVSWIKSNTRDACYC